jgi:nucleoid-associated protein YgaU
VRYWPRLRWCLWPAPIHRSADAGTASRAASARGSSTSDATRTPSAGTNNSGPSEGAGTKAHERRCHAARQRSGGRCAAHARARAGARSPQRSSEEADGPNQCGPAGGAGGRIFPLHVQREETLSKIAQQYLGDRLRFWILAKYNDIPIPNRLQAEQVIKIPVKSRHPRRHGLVHRRQPARTRRPKIRRRILRPRAAPRLR